MKYSKYIPIISAAGDILLLNILFNLLFCYLKGFDQICTSQVAIFFYIYVNLSWLTSAGIFNVYEISRQSYKKAILFNNIKAIVFFFFVFLLFFQVFTFNYYSRDNIKFLFIGFFTLIIIWKFSLYYLFLYYRKSGYNYRNVIVVGHNDKAYELKDYFIRNPWAGYRFKGFFTNKDSSKKDIIGTINDIESFTLNNKIDEIYIITSEIQYNVQKAISSIVSKHPVKIRLVPDMYQFSNMRLKLTEYDFIPVIQVQQGLLNRWYNRTIKRLFDILCSIIVIILVLSWLVPIIAIINLFMDKGGIFFVQKRTGFNNRPFNVIKFRTMSKNDYAHSKSATVNDVRITKFGKFLRKSSIDELPQFFNVLIGNMSVVGPRPHMLMHTDEYKVLVKKFMIRHSVKPGITGYAQVRGFRGEIVKIKDMKNRVKQDVFYIENWSIWLDFKIVFLTFGQILKGNDKAY